MKGRKRDARAVAQCSALSTEDDTNFSPPHASVCSEYSRYMGGIERHSMVVVPVETWYKPVQTWLTTSAAPECPVHSASPFLVRISSKLSFVVTPSIPG